MTMSHNQSVHSQSINGQSLPFGDRQDFADADKGFIAKLDPCRITDNQGRVIWNNDAYDFLAEDCPDTANPSLWRQSQLCAKQGLYEVTNGIYQVRGLDLSNMTVVEGETGIIVIDPLISAECATAALELYRKHRGERPVTGVIYTHAHVDHFGGVAGVVDRADVIAGRVPVVAPHGFMEHAVAENVYAGTAMTRRAGYMYGPQLPVGPEGQIGVGLGMTTSTGQVTLIAPTVDITETGQEETIDGVRIIFQLTPGTESPAEMNFLFPESRALCMAENATHNLHNVLTLRGALVRDARMWSRYLSEAITFFAGQYDVLFASHHWPTWGAERAVMFLSEQRDLYAYLHDQTLRLLNQGHTGAEIAENFELPASLANTWHVRGYYGSISHNVKAIYQRYMGWFDGVPAHLWEHPPVESARRSVECMGGVEAVLLHAARYQDKGDLRFAAQLLQQAVFTEPEHERAKESLAHVYERLGFACESGTWRNFYLTGAMELRHGIAPVEVDSGNDLAMALSIEQLFDTMAIRLDGPRAQGEQFSINWTFADLDKTVRTQLSNGALIYMEQALGEPDVTVHLTKLELLMLLAGKPSENIRFEGNAPIMATLFGFLDEPEPNFPIVTP